MMMMMMMMLMMMMIMMTIEVSGDSASQRSGGSPAGNQHGHPLDLSSAACYQNFRLLNENSKKFNINSWIGGSLTYRQPLDLQYHICSAAWPKFYITEWKLPRSSNAHIVIIPLNQADTIGGARLDINPTRKCFSAYQSILLRTLSLHLKCWTSCASLNAKENILRTINKDVLLF